MFEQTKKSHANIIKEGIKFSLKLKNKQQFSSSVDSFSIEQDILTNTAYA